MDRTVPLLVVAYAAGIALAAASPVAAALMGVSIVAGGGFALRRGRVRPRRPRRTAAGGASAGLSAGRGGVARRGDAGRSVAAGRVVLLVAAAGLGWMRGQPPPGDGPGALRPRVGEGVVPVVLDGTVLRAPDAPAPSSEERTGPILLATSTLATADGRVRAEGEALVFVDRPPPGLAPGDRVRVVGTARLPRPPRGPDDGGVLPGSGGPRVLVDAAGPGGVRTVARAPPWAPSALAFRARTAVLRSLRSRVDGPGGPMLEALLLGRRESLDEDLVRAMQRTGTWHVLVVSGLHVALAGAAAARLAGALGAGPRGRAAAALALAGSYAAVTGMGAPVFRALIALALALAGSAFRRRGDPLHALSLAAGWLLWEDPSLLFRPGFQMSVAAVLGLLRASSGIGAVLFARRRLLARFPLTRPRGWRRPVGDALEGGLGPAVAAWAFTAPITAHHFGVVSPLGPLANLVVVPLALLALSVAPLLALSAAAGGMAGMVASALAAVLAEALHRVALVLESLPGSWSPVPPPGAPLLTGCGLVLGVLALRGIRGRTSLVALVAVPLALVAGLPSGAAAPPRPSVLVLDAGHGLCALLTGRSSKILVDAGGRAPGVVESSLLPSLRAAGAGRLDLVVVSHEDSDHAGGVPALLDRFAVGALAVPEGFGVSRAGREVLAAAARHAVPVLRVAAGDTLPLGLDVVEFLQPSRGAPLSGTCNDGSLVLRWRAPGLSALLPGDLEDGGIDELLRRGGDLGADLLLLPHHGSARVLQAPILAAATGAAVLVASDGTGTGAPAAFEAGDALYLRTSRRGPVLVRPGEVTTGEEVFPVPHR